MRSWFKVLLKAAVAGKCDALQGPLTKWLSAGVLSSHNVASPKGCLSVLLTLASFRASDARED